jgi:signal peptide peptidase SppA
MEFTVGGVHVAIGTIPLLLILGGIVLIFFSIRRRRRKREEKKNLTDRVKLGLSTIRGSETFESVSAIVQKNTIVVVHVNGVILESSLSMPSFMPGFVTFGEDLEEILARAERNDHVGGVLVRFNTPGGTVIGSELIRAAMQRFGEKKPLVAYVSGISASGGVWSMVAARHIISHREAMLGSIGVMGPTIMHYKHVTGMGHGFLHGEVHADEINAQVLYAGQGKAFGNPHVAPDPETVARFQSMLDQTRQRFLGVVLEGRPAMQPRDLADLGANIISAEEAWRIRLVDELGDARYAEETIAGMIGLAHDDCHFEAIRRKSVREKVMMAAADLGLPMAHMRHGVRAALAQHPLNLVSPHLFSSL